MYVKRTKLIPIPVVLAVLVFYSKPVHAQNELENSRLTIQKGFVDSETGTDYSGPFLVQSDGHRSAIFAFGKIDAIRLSETVPFILVVDHNGHGVESTLKYAVFPTRLSIGGNVLMGREVSFNIKYELEISDFELGEFKETMHFFTEELKGNDSHDFDLTLGRVLHVEIGKDKIPIIKQFESNTCVDDLIKTIKSDRGDNDKAVDILSLLNQLNLENEKK